MPYPPVADISLVGSYPAQAKAGGGYVWDEVLEYRVWCHPERGAPDRTNGNDYHYAFASYAEALAFSEAADGADVPLALVLQREYIDEPEPECSLTLRSTGAPTAGHQARPAGTRYIVCGPGLASCRCRPVSSTLGAGYANRVSGLAIRGSRPPAWWRGHRLRVHRLLLCPTAIPAGTCDTLPRTVSALKAPAAASGVRMLARAGGLTLRSTGAPTAGHALAARLLWFIIRLAAKAPTRRRPVSSTLGSGGAQPSSPG
jgi:hypothetical protein